MAVMPAVQFDTLRFVERLKSAGVPEAQAKAEAEALAIALTESAFVSQNVLASLATKDDVNALKLDLADVKAEMRLHRWMLGIIVAGVVALVLKAFF